MNIIECGCRPYGWLGLDGDRCIRVIPRQYPAKRTRSSGPVTWDCPFCEDKKYADNLEYLIHLQKAHKCNLPGCAVKKDIKKGKPGKSSKGQGKR